MPISSQPDYQNERRKTQQQQFANYANALQAFGQFQQTGQQLKNQNAELALKQFQSGLTPDPNGDIILGGQRFSFDPQKAKMFHGGNDLLTALLGGQLGLGGLGGLNTSIPQPGVPTIPATPAAQTGTGGGTSSFLNTLRSFINKK